MSVPAAASPALSVALALAAGMGAQLAARHLQLPGIVLLLGVGVLLGPDVAGLVQPATLGGGLHALVGFAVAVILFEGSMALDVRRLQHQALSIRRLVTLGVAVTAVGSTLVARWTLGWEWPLAMLFGSLVVVTGPTVIQPLLRRLRVRHELETVLEAEAIFGDAIGATLAVAALEVVLGSSFTLGPWLLVSRFGAGALVGGVVAVLVVVAMRADRWVPDGFESPLVLALVLACYQLSEVVRAESGVVAVIVAGFVVGNLRPPRARGVREFKEHLTLILLGMLFVLLAADVRMEEVRALGWRGVAAVALLMLVVRPLNAFLSTAGSALSLRERAFIAWLAPRGIVAAAVASLFADSLAAAGIAGGRELRAMVFLVIAITVVVQGSTGGVVAAALGVRRPPRSGFLVLGANPLGRFFASALQRAGQAVTLVDANPESVRTAERDGLTAVHGSAIDDELLERWELTDQAAAVALTPNEDVNLLFARRARMRLRLRSLWLARRLGRGGVTPAMVREAGAGTLFGTPVRLERWMAAVETDAASILRCRAAGTHPRLPVSDGEATTSSRVEDLLLPLFVRRGDTVRPVDETTALALGDEVFILVRRSRRGEAAELLEQHGLEPAEPGTIPVPAS